MRQADRLTDQSFEDVLEACRVLLFRGATIDACLAAYPSHADALAELLPTAMRARALAREPDPVHAAEARRRFLLTMAAARENRTRAESARYRGPFGWLARLAVPVAIVLVLSASGFGLVNASDGSLPDNPLYTVKQGSNNIALLLARTPKDRAGVNARIANRQRLDLDNAEQAHKGPVVRLVIAKMMVEASDRATDQALLMSEPERTDGMKRLAVLLQMEQKSLNPLSNDPRVQVATDAKGYQQELESDILRLKVK
jgi:hypothetical protein